MGKVFFGVFEKIKLKIEHLFSIYIQNLLAFNSLCYEFFYLTDFSETLYTGVFRIADYESEVRIVKFKMADLIWRTNNPKICFMKISTWGF